MIVGYSILFAKLVKKIVKFITVHQVRITQSFNFLFLMFSACQFYSHTTFIESITATTILIICGMFSWAIKHNRHLNRNNKAPKQRPPKKPGYLDLKRNTNGGSCSVDVSIRLPQLLMVLSAIMIFPLVLFPGLAQKLTNDAFANQPESRFVLL